MFTLSFHAHLACVLEVTARKPGNVHRFQDFADVTYLEFLLSAAAMAPLMDGVRERGVGPTILEGVRRTRQVTRTNTNLGILLLLTPLAAVPPELSLPQGVGAVLEELTVKDAQAVYEAIRLAQPGGLGKVSEQDVADEPTQTLRQVMALAAERDLVARQYENGYKEVFETAVPTLLQGLAEEWPLEEAIIYTHLKLMATHPDTLIARKRGPAEAEESARRAGEVLTWGWPTSTAGQTALRELDQWLRGSGHRRNPGTTADLVTAALFVALREGTLTVPVRQPWYSTRL